jgi:hypothetical protein
MLRVSLKETGQEQQYMSSFHVLQAANLFMESCKNVLCIAFSYTNRTVIKLVNGAAGRSFSTAVNSSCNGRTENGLSNSF